MNFRELSLGLALLAIGASPSPLLANPLSPAAAQAPLDPRWAIAQERRRVVPLVAAHQHLLSPVSVPKPRSSLPIVQLPTDFARLLSEREDLSGSNDFGEVFTEDALVLWSEDYTWARGQFKIRANIGLAEKGLRFLPNAYAEGGSAGYISGTVRRSQSAVDVQNFLLALQKASDGKWRIAAETDTNIEPPDFTKPVTADQLVQELDDAGIQRGVVLSIAYWYGSPSHPPVENEYAMVRAENDWTAQQVARYPNRLVFFCGVNPLKDYAIEELERCARIPLMKGMKLHFSNSGVDLRDPRHLERLREFFRAANSHRLAMVIHIRSLRGDYGRQDSEIFLRELLPLAPDIVIQLAHLAGDAPGYGSDDAMATYAEALAAGDPRTRNLYFDVTNNVTLKLDQSQETLALIARRLRQAGLKRIFFGSDMSTDASGPVGPWWVAFRDKLPLTNAELRVIASNIPPYLQ